MIATATASAFIPRGIAAAPGQIGGMSVEEFKAINKAAGDKVKAIEPGSERLSGDDGKLMERIALGGMMQLELSRLATKMAKSDDVRTIADAEVEEQLGLSAKLKKVAAAKGATLPESPDEETKKMMQKLQGLFGAEFDKAYLTESGVKGHALLNKTMVDVQAKAGDETLKAIAKTALPLIQTHLRVAEEELQDFA
jgi:putative membrane protein